MLVDGFEIGGSTLGERRSDIIVNSVQASLSLHNVESSIFWIPSWALDWCVWAPSGASDNASQGSEFGLFDIGLSLGLLELVQNRFP